MFDTKLHDSQRRSDLNPETTLVRRYTWRTQCSGIFVDNLNQLNQIDREASVLKIAWISDKLKIPRAFITISILEQIENKQTFKFHRQSSSYRRIPIPPLRIEFSQSSAIFLWNWTKVWTNQIIWILYQVWSPIAPLDSLWDVETIEVRLEESCKLTEFLLFH